MKNQYLKPILFTLLSLFFGQLTAWAQQFSKTGGTFNSVVGLNSTNGQKFQMMYDPTEFTGITSGVIDKIYFNKNLSGSGSTVLTNLYIRLGKVAVGTFYNGSGIQFFDNLTPVFFSSSYTVSASSGWFSIDVQNQFLNLNGAKLIVEVSYSTSSSSTFYLNATTGLSAPSNPGLYSSITSSTTGVSTSRSLDIGFDYTTSLAAPLNDACASASALAVGSGCDPISGNSIGGTQSLAPAACSGFTSSASNDVWYTFVPYGVGDSIAVGGNGGFDPIIQIFSGTCASLTPIACIDGTVSNGIEALAPGLNPGQTYYLRVYGWAGQDGGFQVCAKSDNVPAPTNDVCSTPLVLTPSSICNGTVGNNTGADQDLQPLTCGTATSSTANDVWYTFTAQSAGDSVIVDPNGTFDPVLEIFSGPCTALNKLACSDNPTNGLATEKVAPGTLIPGTVYTVRVYGYNGSEGTFAICVKTLAPTAPANDACASAVTLTSNTFCSGTNGTIVNATQSLPAITCNNFTSSQANDVWYKFVAGSSGDSVIVTPFGVFDPVAELYSGNCSSLVSIGCSDAPSAATPEKISPGNLIAGNTYFVRIYGFGASTGTFSICIKRPPSSTVANDECATATTVTVGVGGCQFPVAGNTLGATASPQAACAGIADDDVWYKFTVATSGLHKFRVNGLSGFDAVMQIYSGTCTSLTQLACIDRTVSGVQEDTLLNLTAGQTIYVRIYHYFSGAGGSSFGLCIDRVVAPAHDNCSGAMTMTVNSATTCSAIYTSNYGATQSLAPATCSNSVAPVANDIWIKFVATSANARVRVRGLGAADPVVEGFTGTCTALVSTGCVDDSAAGNGESLYMTNLTIGQTYYARIYGFSPVYGDYEVCVQQVNCLSVAGNTSVTPLNTVSNGAILANQTGYVGTVTWQYAFGGNTTFSSLAGSVPDTFYVTSQTNQALAIRAQVTNGVCAPAFSSPVSVNIRCATPLTNANPLPNFRYITNVNFAGINNPSSVDPLKGAYQNFRNLTGSACLGTSRTISVSLASSGMYVAVWMDYNNDGDFDDEGENVVAPTLSSNLFTTNLNLNSALAVPGSTVTMRVFAFNPGTSIPSSSACFAGPYDSGEIEEYSIQLLGQPTQANAGTNFSTCVPSANLAGNVPTSGTGTWTLLSGSGLISSPNSPTSAVTNLGQGVNIFRWTISNSCGSSVSEVAVTYSGPSQVANAGADQSICAESASLAGNAPSGSSTGTWTAIAGTGVVNSPNSANSTVSGLSAGINRFVWSLSVPGCGTSTDTVTITRSLNPTPASAGLDQSVCGNSAQLSASPITVGTGIWTLVSGSGQISNPNQSTTQVSNLGSGLNVFRWTTSNGTCPSSQDEVQITVTPSVQANAGSNQTICADQVTLQGNSPSPGTGSWSILSGSGTISNSGQFNTSVSGLGAGSNQFIWTISNGTCPATKDTVTIVRVVAQSAFAGLDQSVCGGNGTLSATPASSGTGVWTLVSGSGNLANPQDPASTVSNLGTGANTFRWTITNAPCPVASDDVVITNLGNATLAQAGTDQTICGTSATLAGNTATFGVGQWSLISGSGTFSNPGSPNSGVTGLAVGLNVFRWTITNGNCPPSFDDVIITRVASPSVASAGQDQNLCVATATLSANVPSSGTGVWTLVSGSGIISDPTSSVTQVVGLASGTNTFRWTVSNAPCPASTDEVVITTSSNAVLANAGQDQVLCNTTTTLAGNNPGNGSGQWTVVSGAGTFANPNAFNTQVADLGEGTNVFRWTITNGACPPTSDEVNVVRSASSSTANAGQDQNLCTASATLAANAAQSGVGTWTLISGTGTITNPNDPNTTVTGLGNGTNVFRWTILNFPCPASADDVNITTTLSAVTANAGTDQTICGTNSQLIGNSPGAGTGQWNLIQGSGNITNFTSNSTSVTGLSPGVNIFSWTITTGTCPPSSDQVVINVVTNPIAANAGADQNICGTSATLVGNQAGLGTGTWSLVSGAGTIANPNDPNSTVLGLGNGANVFRWTISNSPCLASFDEVTINATPGNVTANAGADRVLCGSSAFLNGVAPVSGFGVWSVVSGSAVIAEPGNPVTAVTNLGPGANTLAWTVTSGNCSASDLVTLTREVNPLNLGDDSLACIGSQVVLSAGSGFASYLWFDGSNQPTLTVGSSNNYWVQVQTTNGCTFRDTIQVTFVICSDVEETLSRKNDQIEVFPNPTDGNVQLMIQTELPGDQEVRVLNATGVEIFHHTFHNGEGKNLYPMDLRTAPAGMYMLEIRNASGRHIRKLIIR